MEKKKKQPNHQQQHYATAYQTDTPEQFISNCLLERGKRRVRWGFPLTLKNERSTWYLDLGIPFRGAEEQEFRNAPSSGSGMRGL